MALTKSDFYFGALLSRLVKTGFAPAIIEHGEKRRIYSLSNDLGEYKIYTKYLSKPTRVNRRSIRWDFPFTTDEVREIKSFNSGEEINYLFGFVCTKDEMKDSEVVFLTYEQVRECFGRDYLPSDSKRVTIILEPGSWSYTAYGTGLDKVENGLKITRNVEKRLDEIGFVYDEVISEK